MIGERGAPTSLANAKRRARGALLAAVVCLMACAGPKVPQDSAIPTSPVSGAGNSMAAPAPRTVETVLDGKRTRVDVFSPLGRSDSAVILVHGFTRTRATMSGHGQMLAQAGLLAIAPDLPYLVDSRDNARALADLVAQVREGRLAPAAERIVLVGFSAGGLAALLAAGSPGVVGYIGLDPFDRPSGIGREFAARLAVPAVLLRAPPSACNAYSIAAPWAQALPRLELDRVFDGARHCDFESPSDWLCRLACGAPDPDRQAAIAAEILRVVRGWLLTQQ